MEDSTCPELYQPRARRRPTKGKFRPTKGKFRMKRSPCGPMKSGASEAGRTGPTCKIGWTPSGNCKPRWSRRAALRPGDSESATAAKRKGAPADREPGIPDEFRGETLSSPGAKRPKAGAFFSQ